MRNCSFIPFNMRIILVMVFASVLLVSYAQDCKVGGKRCSDTEQCCGGCCIEGVCIDSSRLCSYSQDVCEDHSCIGEESCVAYLPPECGGCEPVPLCTLLQ